MSAGKSKLNLKIINELERNSKNDLIIFNFIKDLLLQEVFTDGRGQWRESYLEKIDKSSNDWMEENEN